MTPETGGSGALARTDSATLPREGVVILGMHRSGTSLVTRLVSLLGLAICRREDLLAGRARNPRGYWESKSLVRFNDRLLAGHGRSWFCPPVLQADDVSRMLRKHADEALATLREAHPEQPWVWKDPRTCVLLPFWSAVLEQRVAYVLVVRHPFEVSDSLASRNGCTPLLSLALWERYTREAMLGAAGRAVMVCTYDEVLADPIAWCERLRAFTAELGLATRPVNQVAVEAFAMDGLRHSQRAWDELQPGAPISPEQVALAAAASVFTAQSVYAPPALPPESARTEEIFKDIAKRTRRTRRLSVLPAHLVTAKPDRATDTGESSRRPVSVVLARGDAAGVQATVAALGATLPTGTEMLVAGGDEAGAGAAASLPEGISLRQIAGDRPSSEAAALALGAQAAMGRIVLLAGSSLESLGDWFASAQAALALSGIGGVAPALRLRSRPQERYLGRTFGDRDVACSPAVGDAAETLVPTPLLPAAACACDRALLAAAGGVDADFISPGAAVAELSLRLWRIGFRCCILTDVEAWVTTIEGDDAADEAADVALLYDRMRIAALHLGAERLQAFTDGVRELPSYEPAAERLAASEVERRRTAVEAVCTRSLERALALARQAPGVAGAGGDARRHDRQGARIAGAHGRR